MKLTDILSMYNKGMSDMFLKMVFPIGKKQSDGVALLGTCFLIGTDGLVATTAHVAPPDAEELVLIIPESNSANDYQDLDNDKLRCIDIELTEISQLRDISILKTKNALSLPTLDITSFDDVEIGEEVEIWGFPHCIYGRKILTLQKAEIGAKFISGPVKSKYCVINTQAQPGQSGSIIYSPKNKSIVGMLLGAYIPKKSGILLGNIDPFTLHQTTHCISAEYIKEMI